MILAALVVVANRRRTINQVWALALVLLALWQASVAGVQLLGGLFFVRLAVFFAGCAVVSMSLLKEVIVAPKRAFREQLWNIRYYLATMPLYGLVLIVRFPSLDSYGASPVYWAITILCIGSGCFIVISSLALVLKGKVAGSSGRELKAFVGLAGACFATALVSTVLGRISGVRYIRWFTPSILIVGLLFFASFVARDELVDTYDVKQKLFLWGARGIGCVFVGLFFVSSIALLRVMSLGWALAYCAVSGIMLVALPMIDRQFRMLLDKRFVSPGFHLLQSDMSAETEKRVLFSDLHAGYAEVLKRWADGSSEIFLSEGVFSASWPAAAIPETLLRLVFKEGWITPEILERRGSVGDETETYLLCHQIGAAIGYVSPRGEKLLALFRVRSSGKPFVWRELREGFELLRQMQVGLAFAKMRQTQRSDDRLNFYGRYAPQFVHEVRNGLYLQAQLLRAIANGRGETVLPSDAKAGLEKMEQLDRLCKHFFNVGAVFKQPIRAIRLREALVTIVDKARTQIEQESGAEVCLRIDAPDDAQILGNPDMLAIAVQNLLLNSADALSSVLPPRRIEIAATTQFEKVRVLVRDNGPGMPLDKRQDPFSPGLSHKKGGMGLGLSIVRDCIEAMGGNIGLRPHDGSGACFEITLACPPPERRDKPLPNPSFSNGLVRPT